MTSASTDPWWRTAFGILAPLVALGALAVFLDSYIARVAIVIMAVTIAHGVWKMMRPPKTQPK